MHPVIAIPAAATREANMFDQHYRMVKWMERRGIRRLLRHGVRKDGQERDAEEGI